MSNYEIFAAVGASVLFVACFFALPWAIQIAIWVFEDWIR